MAVLGRGLAGYNFTHMQHALAANALRWAVDEGILDNVPFQNATEKATRAQTAQMLTNYLRG